jgi:hypothetical protein
VRGFWLVHGARFCSARDRGILCLYRPSEARTGKLGQLKCRMPSGEKRKILHRFQQQWRAVQRFVQQRVQRALMMIALLTCAATWGIAGSAVVYAQAPASPPYISPPVKPLEVNVPPPPPAAKPAAPDPRAPMVTIPEGEPLPTEPPPPRRPIPDPVIQSDQGGPAQKQKRE